MRLALIAVFLIISLICLSFCLYFIFRHTSPPPPQRERESSKFNLQWTSDATSIQKELLDLLKDTLKVFEQIDLSPEYVVAYGTLLGTIRDEAIIPWDDDIDLFITQDLLTKLKLDFEKPSSQSVLKQNSLWFIIDDDLWRIRRTNCCKYCLPPWIDLFVLKPCPNKRDCLYEEKVNLHIQIDEFFPIKTAIFSNLTVQIPSNPVAILERHYGTTWNIPIPSPPHSHRGYPEKPYYYQNGECTPTRT